jgi:hypothetical protein
MRREVRWLLWGLWSVCFVIAVWTVVTVVGLEYVLLTHCWTWAHGCF